jgi:hypothetical protein
MLLSFALGLMIPIPGTLKVLKILFKANLYGNTRENMRNIVSIYNFEAII